MGPAQHGPDLVPTWAQPALNIIGPDSFHTGKHCALCLPQFNIALPGFARRISAQSSHTIHHKSLLGRRPAVRRKPLNNNNKIDIDIHWYTLSEAEADTKQCLDLPITVGIKLCRSSLGETSPGGSWKSWWLKQSHSNWGIDQWSLDHHSNDELEKKDLWIDQSPLNPVFDDD